MRILLVFDNYYPYLGGAETIYQSLAEGLIKKGHQATVITSGYKNWAANEMINGVQIIRIKSPFSFIEPRYWLTFCAIFPILKIGKSFDLIQTSTFTSAGPAWLAAKILRKKVLIIIHEVWLKKWQKFSEMNFFSCFLHRIFEKLILSLNFEKYICVSQATKDDLLAIGKPKKKVVTIYNGIDYDFWNVNKYNSQNIKERFKLNNCYTFLYYGRPGISKGLEYLINAIPLVKIPKVKYIFILSQKPLARYHLLRKKIENLKLNNIILLPQITKNDLPNYLMAADCIIIPSLTEGFGFNVIEAGALGKTILSTRTGSIPEVISGRGLLVEPAMAKELAYGMQNIYQNKFQTYPIRKFPIEKMVDNYCQLYSDLLKKKKQ